MKNYTVTLWRYPSEEREPNAVGVSVFYFNETAEDEAKALEQAKEKFQHSVWESDVQEEEPKLANPTKGELYVSTIIQPEGAFIYSKDFPESAIARCYADNRTVESKEEAKANADRIVKAVNMHDELLRFIKIISIHDEHFLSQDAFNTREDCEREIMHLAKKASQLLKQAEQK